MIFLKDYKVRYPGSHDQVEAMRNPITGVLMEAFTKMHNVLTKQKRDLNISFEINERITTLKETIESISKQSYSNYEHIVVIDKKDEKLDAIVEEYPRTKCIYEKEYSAGICQ